MPSSKKPAQSSSADDDEQALHPIQVVARRSALTAHVIRAWERRYNAVEPKRSASNRRLYTDEDIQRLRLLNQAIGLGRRIGDIAHLSLQDLVALVDEDQQAIIQAPDVVDSKKSQPTDKSAAEGGGESNDIIETCLQAIESLDPIAFESTLARAAVDYSSPVLLEKVVCQVMHTVGQRWREGSLRLCHEHMATTIVRSFLGTMVIEADYNMANDYAPVLLTTTPDGQRHELGALMVALVAASKGWKPLYLGASTPIDEIVFAAIEKSAKAVALSICYPADDPYLSTALKKLRRQLPREISILIGGASANNYQATLDAIGAICPDNLNTLQDALDDLRETGL